MKTYLKKYKILLFFTVLFNVISSLGFVFIAILLQKVMDIVMIKDIHKLYQIIIFSIGYIILLGIFMYLQTLLSKKMICKITYNIRSKLFNGIINQNFEEYNKNNTADYISIINNDVKLIEDNYLLPLFEIIQYGVIFIASLGVMFYFNVVITIYVIIAIMFMLIIPSIFGKALEKRQNNYSYNLSLFTNELKDMLSGFEIIKSYSIKKQVLLRYEKSNSSTIKSKYNVDKLTSFNEGLSMTLSLFVQIFVLLLSAYFIVMGRTSVGTLLGMIQATSNLANPFLNILSNIPKLRSTYSIIKKINKYTDYEIDSKITHAMFKEAIDIKDLSFSYDSKNKILKEINCNFIFGKKYVIVGRSGCGKTTLVKLLTGNYLGYKGIITYDGVELRNLDIESINNISSTIHQNVYLFNENILDNICLYQTYSKATIDLSLKESGLLDFVKDDLLYRVGENGSNLSGGQKQRIAVARALIRNKPLIILDEGTSAVDMQTAYDIENKLLQIKNLTLITITHNLRRELLESYDEVIYMEDGKIVEHGSFSELLQKKASFFDYFTLKVNE